MFTNYEALPSNDAGNQLPMRPRTPASTDRRPTLNRVATSGGGMFGGWGPRLG
jgi:hypothetical protein